ncbi:acylneuraminate cytidylyltransferase family protein [Pseudoalteromonas fuliginea]|uniref:Acylneuraminate cytidylyltransferase family protein n=1 Tax=Pseudoalteromonas fuliginea TaxID=1872678 RepID=A0AB73BIE2_9GAMM|nr:acylneuraminate cytidylyltransferase family protein [Pseudoalteromonas fuliginea]KAA1162034.1 acylneuraminate cytidylyltransferase family protein [Pseudoalteromonas fuliginea]
MINGKTVLAIIPARGGSKRLPQKNILPINGKPLIVWSIEATKNSKYIDSIFVSTDDENVALIAEECGLNIPELRPAELASDEASTEEMLLYTLNKFGRGYDIVILLQPTSPLRTFIDIDAAIDTFIQKKAFSVVSVTPCEHSPLWSNKLPADCNMGSFIKQEALKRSQELGEFYRLNGAIYIFDTKKLKEYGKIIYSESSFAFVMDNLNSIDIDTKLDFEIAEVLLKKLYEE